jgi:hypothetical protein
MLTTSAAGARTAKAINAPEKGKCFHSFVSFFVLNFVMRLNQRAAVRWLVDLDLLFITTRLETVFGLVSWDVETVFAAESDEGKNGE